MTTSRATRPFRRSAARPLAAGAVAAMLMASLAACGGDGAAASAESTIRIGVLLPLTGEWAADANPKAADLAAKLINDKGGIGGRKVDVVAYDAGVGPETAVNAANKAVADGIDIAVGGNAYQVQPIEPIFDRAQIPLLSNGSGALVTTAFDLSAPRTAMAEKSVAFAKKALGAATAAVINSNDAGGAQSGQERIDAAKQIGLTIASHQAVAPNATDITPQVLKMKGADVVFAASVPAVDNLVIRTMVQNAVNLPVVLTEGGIFQVTGRLTPAEDLKDVYVASMCAANLPLEAQDQEGAKDYLQAFQANYGTKIPQSPASPQWFDGVTLAAAVVAHADSYKERIAYLRTSVDHQGACGLYKSASDTQLLGSPDNAFIMSAAGGTLKRAKN
jgi:branched-chain amino acid transport system substrate-binding protein